MAFFRENRSSYPQQVEKWPQNVKKEAMVKFDQCLLIFNNNI